MGQIDSKGIGGGISGGALGSAVGLGGSKFGNLSDYANHLHRQGMWETATTSSDQKLTATYVNEAIDNIWKQQQNAYQWAQYGNSVQLYPNQEVDMGGHNTDYSQWTYDPGTRQWDDGTGNKFQCLPVGVHPDQTRLGKIKQQNVMPDVFIGEFTPKGYAKWFRKRLQLLYAA